MSFKQPQALSELLNRVLQEVSDSTGSVAALQPVWYRAVGAHIASHTKLLSFQRGRLRVKCDSEAMRLAVVSQRASLEKELAVHFGASSFVGVDIE